MEEVLPTLILPCHVPAPIHCEMTTVRLSPARGQFFVVALRQTRASTYRTPGQFHSNSPRATRSCNILGVSRSSPNETVRSDRGQEIPTLPAQISPDPATAIYANTITDGASISWGLAIPCSTNYNASPRVLPVTGENETRALLLRRWDVCQCAPTGSQSLQVSSDVSGPRTSSTTGNQIRGLA